MRRGGRTALGLAVGCLVVAGCSDDGGNDAVTLPPATQTPTTTAEASTPPSTPTGSAEPTPTTTLVLPDEHVESVDAFVVDFFAALNAAKDTGDFAAYDALYLPQCTGCVELRDEVKGWLADGGTAEGGDWVLVQQASETLPDLSRATADAFSYRTQLRLLGSNGTETLQMQTEVQWFQFGLLPEGDSWVVQDMGLGQS